MPRITLWSPHLLLGSSRFAPHLVRPASPRGLIDPSRFTHSASPRLTRSTHFAPPRLFPLTSYLTYLAAHALLVSLHLLDSSARLINLLCIISLLRIISSNSFSPRSTSHNPKCYSPRLTCLATPRINRLASPRHLLASFIFHRPAD
ncbi:hypothetical protein ACLB2K_026234 [Fragaria x ananassa]